MDFSAFHKDVVAQLPGAPIPAVNYALLQSAIEYCETSLCLQYDADPIIVRPGVSDYEIALTDDETDVVHVITAKLDGRPVKAIPVDLRPLVGRPAYTYELVTGEADDPTSIRLIDTPEEAATLFLRVAVKPKQDAAELPDDLWRLHRKGICAGAMSKMMLQAGKTWSQPQLGVVRAGEFRAEMNNAQVDANRAQTRAELRVQMRPLA